MQLLSLLIRALQSRPVMGLSGLSCPLFRWRPFCTLTAPPSIHSLATQLELSLTPAPSRSASSQMHYNCSACAEVGTWILTCARDHVRMRSAERSRGRGRGFSETVNNPCQTRGASVDILSLNFDFSSVFVFPFLRCQKWHVYPGAQEDVPKQVFLEYKPTLDNSGVRATSCATSHSYCRLLYSFKTLGFPRLLMGHQNTLHQRPVKNFLRHNRFDRWLFELNKAHTPSLLYRSWELRMCRVIFHNAGKV